MWNSLAWLACTAAVLNGIQSSHASIVFVDGSRAACGDGQTWATAYKHLQDALTTARNSGGAITEIWVAAGTYKPDRDCANPGGTGARAATFQLVDAVALRGGFAGNENPATFDLADRNFETNPTVLSGDLAGNDGANFTNNGENSYNVVWAVDVGALTVLDGLTVSGGNAPGGDEGGGMRMIDSSPSIANCKFVNNWSQFSGGGLFASGSSPRLIACRFTGNGTYSYGGGAAFSEGGAPVLLNCLFSTNQGSLGTELASEPGWQYVGPSMTLVNCTFASNSGSSDVAIYTDYETTTTLTNCIVWGSSRPIEDKSQVLTVTYSCVQNGYTGAGNISTDPKLLADGRLDRSSPCIDAGSNSAVPAGVTKDLVGGPRFVDDPFIPDSAGPEGPAVDMGAHEFQGGPRRIVYVKADAASGGNGQSWSTAYKHLQDGLADAAANPQIDTEIRLSQGVYLPDRTEAMPSGSGNRAASFQLVNRTALYGGFPGEPGQEGAFQLRNPRLHPTILSGDLAGDDGHGFENSGENSHHVLFGNGITALLSGCVISGGNADTGGPNDNGAGLLVFSSNLTVEHCVLENNFSRRYGGGLYLAYGKAIIRRCLFRNNTANMGGGAISRSWTTMVIEDSAFAHNAAPSGFGGALTTGWEPGPAIKGCTFFGNSAQWAGGLYGQDPYGTSPLMLNNCILWGNSAPTYPQLAGSVVATHNCIQGGYAGEGNIDMDPLFVNAGAGDLRLQAGSPCIDAGKNMPTWGALTDLLGLPRFIDDAATPDCRWAPGTCGTAPIVDMGAHEFVIMPGDLDDDYDVDADDLDLFISCAAGPGLVYQAGCESADLNDDQQVDSTDFGIFQRCLSGAGRVANPACAD